MNSSFFLLCLSLLLGSTYGNFLTGELAMSSSPSTYFLDTEWTTCVGVFKYNSISPSGPIQDAGLYLINMCMCPLQVQFSWYEYFSGSYPNPISEVYYLPPANQSSKNIYNWERTNSSSIESSSDMAVSSILALEGTVETCVTTSLQNCVKFIVHAASHSRYSTWAYNRCDKDVYLEYFCGDNNYPTSVTYQHLPAWTLNNVARGTLPNNGLKLKCNFKIVVFSVTPA